jgi:GTP pyrophosphokinase
MSVAGIVADFGGNEDQVIAALLHDAVEDQGGPPRQAEIEGRFGTRVARIVADCTDADADPRPPWRTRKEAYISRIRTADTASLLVSAADKLHNARSIVADLQREGPTALQKFTGKREGTLWYYRALVTAYESRDCDPILIGELARTVRRMQDLAGDQS